MKYFINDIEYEETEFYEEVYNRTSSYIYRHIDDYIDDDYNAVEAYGGTFYMSDIIKHLDEPLYDTICEEEVDFVVSEIDHYLDTEGQYTFNGDEYRVEKEMQL